MTRVRRSESQNSNSTPSETQTQAFPIDSGSQMLVYTLGVCPDNLGQLNIQILTSVQEDGTRLFSLTPDT